MSVSDGRRMSLTELNALPGDELVRRLGSVFEHSPWVAEGAGAARPFADFDAAHAAMMSVVLARSVDDQIAFLRAHPRLASRSRREAALAVESQAEQKAAGLDGVEEEKGELLDLLNRQYEERFGFPFIIAARENTIDSIIEALRRRMTASRDEEIAEALRQIATITRWRLGDLLETER
ncbi:2-oxo-4-hydroxy-4-carboxy-5-ureidoimidazoline decarboxylase [Terrihabitans rhizophilus]|uniref:2-oxo-4-hydroxy-4-carboxy-5-ureidoimidazoline decarboxylase n=1 Tax=Terrihabitans rhizophilus TaxID=3092662 RepID=A0ABU4RMA5_9HYPH|nr:2-oxo-4-hydroxy-4-carboxy-5-ureidoimidazoline decarboxylase [Terrihabitans sp. PJ23]MDX6805956.1 2-oxo-4-hydroxy-4-carboxy-5-ureidoimidazoline decarboxylase [Terrihabitans sp. PJ23]